MYLRFVMGCQTPHANSEIYREQLAVGVLSLHVKCLWMFVFNCFKWSLKIWLQICFHFHWFPTHQVVWKYNAIYFTSSTNLSIGYFQEREKNRNGIEISCIPLFLDPCNKLTLIATNSWYLPNWLTIINVVLLFLQLCMCCEQRSF